MRIVLDLQGAQTDSRLRGIGRYSLSFAQAIARNKGIHDVFIVLNGLFPDTVEPIRAAFEGLLPQENIFVWQAAGPVISSDPRNMWRLHTAELVRESLIESLRPDIVHLSSVIEGYQENAVMSIGLLSGSSIPTAATLYDLIPLMYPEHYLKPDPAYADFYKQRLAILKKADHYLAISESAQRDAIEHLRVSADDTVNISAAADDRFRPLDLPAPEEESLRRRMGLTRPFIMYAGTPDARKNHMRLIKAYSLLPKEARKGHQLALVGYLPDSAEKKFLKQLKKCGLKTSDVVMTGAVTDDEIVQLYNLCEFFVFPSWHEGFGLPALEAMSCGTPVIAANTSSLPEVVGREDALFDPFDEADIARKMAEMIGNGKLRDGLSRHGLARARNFSWDKTALRAIEAFEGWHAERAKAEVVPIMQPSLSKISSEQHLIEMISRMNLMPVEERDLLKTAEAIVKNRPAASNKTLLVDVSELVQTDAGTGIQRVVRSVLSELMKNPPEGYAVEPVYATLGRHGYRYARNFTREYLGQAVSAAEDDYVDVRAGDVFLGLDWPSHVVRYHKDYLLEWRRRGVRIFFVVYDLLPVQHPQFFRNGAAQNHQSWCETISHFDGALCISRAVADDFHDWLQALGPKGNRRPFSINWFHLGADIKAAPVPSSTPAKGADGKMRPAQAGRPSFLMVGTIEPRKGHAQVLQAFELLWKQGVDVNLVIIGKEGWMVDKLASKLRHHRELGQRLFWLDKASDKELMEAYAASTCLIAASEGEGFGLPLIEAAHQKLPIIARDLPVFLEVAGEHAFYFSGLKPEALATGIREWLMLDSAGKAPRSEGMPWLTWRQSTESLTAALLGGKAYKTWNPGDRRSGEVQATDTMPGKVKQVRK
ncbi:MAG: glycosyltransferase [Alphaproteobacteria bacterium]|nr:glycosyltransferase [Alphaproteobacteria bacterium]